VARGLRSAFHLSLHIDDVRNRWLGPEGAGWAHLTGHM
jgi:hypothetical protein